MIDLHRVTIDGVCKVYLNVPRPLDVLAVVAPVPGAAEPLGPQLALEHPGHLDTVPSLQEVELQIFPPLSSHELPQTHGCSLM